MKLIYAFSLCFLSLPALAQTYTSHLDLTNLYRGYNAGAYEAKIEVIPFAGDKVEKISRDVRQDDGYYTCSTSVTVKIATMIVTLKNSSGWAMSQSRDIIASTGETEDGDNCTIPDSAFQGKRMGYASVGANAPFVLPTKATWGYDRVDAWISPFMLGLTFDLDLGENPGKDLALVKLSAAATQEYLNKLSAKQTMLNYYITFASPGTHLSMGMGEVEMKK